MVHITAHAIIRFRERVEDLPDELVIERLSRPVFQAAAEFGAPYVKLGTGQRVVIRNGVMVTVLPYTTHPHSLRNSQ